MKQNRISRNQGTISKWVTCNWIARRKIKGGWNLINIWGNNGQKLSKINEKHEIIGPGSSMNTK